MDNDFMQYVCARCEKALIENTTYRDLQRKCIDASKNNDITLYEELSCKMDVKAQELCFLQGYNDAMRMILNIS